MTSPIDLTAKIRIIIEMDRPGPGAKELEEDLVRVKVTMGDLNNSTNIYRTTTISTTASVRHLLLNLRMFSFGIRTLRREFGDTNPALEAFSTALIVFAAVGSSAVSAVSLFRGAVGKVKPLLQASSKEAIALAASMATLGVTWAMVAVVATALIAIPIASWLADAFSGVHSLRQAARDLGADLKILETRIASLRAEQDKFNLGMSATAIRMRELKRAMDLAGEGNKALESQYKSSAAEMENEGIAAAKLALQINSLTVAETAGKAVKEDLARLAAARRQSWGIGGGVFGEEAIAEAMRREGITKGRPSMRTLGAVMQERGPQGLGGGGQAPSVTISFPGAVFNTRDDIVGALEEGGLRAGRIIQNQYAPPGVQE